MVVQVECTFGQNGVFYAGEKLTCTLKFTNTSQKSLVSNDVSYRPSEEFNRPQSSRSSIESNFGRVNTSGFAPKKSNHPNRSRLNSLVGVADQSQGMASHKLSQSLSHIQLDAVKNASQTDLRVQSPATTTATARTSRPNSVSSWFAPFFSPSPESTNAKAEPKEEKLLWGHVQLVGHFIVDPNLIPLNLINEAKVDEVNASNTKRAPYGGGSFHTNPSTINPFGSTINTVKSMGIDSSKSMEQNNVLPVFSTPPSVLFCDLSLPLGESRVYNYEIKLPPNLPPTYRGKSFKILYYLILGTQREKISNDTNKIQLPFRLFSPINMKSGMPEIFDILQPKILIKDESVIKNLDNKRLNRRSINGKKHLTLETDDFISFAINSLDPKKENSQGNEDEMENFGLNHTSEDHLNHSSSLMGILQLSNRNRSASINIHKGDTVVAKISLRKSHYRIGETCYGVVEFLSSPIKCLQIVISLESYEKIGTDFTTLTSGQIDQYTKIVHSETMKVCSNLERTGFALTIPPTCSQAFQTSVADYQYRLKLEFLTYVKELSGIGSVTINSQHILNKVMGPNNSEFERFSCLVPLNVIPTDLEGAKLYRPHHNFELG